MSDMTNSYDDDHLDDVLNLGKDPVLDDKENEKNIKEY